MKKMYPIFTLTIVSLVALIVLLPVNAISQQSQASPDQVNRGKYLVSFGSCNDCHSPKNMTQMGPMPDSSLLLSGHPAKDMVPEVPKGAIGPDKWGAMTTNDFTAWAGPWGISYAFNLTPDNVTGTGAWTEQTFIQAMRTGKHMGAGRDILPPMPWFSVNALNDSDLRAVFAYLKSLKPISNQVPMPVPPTEALDHGQQQQQENTR